MAYSVSNNYRTIVYSGGAIYDCELKFNNVQVPNEQISSIKISSPIIDTTSETGSMFHIGTFISKSLEIKFRNLDGLDVTANPIIDLRIGMYTKETYTCLGTESGNYYFEYENIKYKFTMPTVEENDILVFDIYTKKLYLDDTEITLTIVSEITTETLLTLNQYYEYVPIGRFLIDELDENYQKTCTITCMDYAIKFKPQLDISQFFTETELDSERKHNSLYIRF